MSYNLPNDLILAYDELYLGHTERLPYSFFDSRSPENSHRLALELFRYAVETRLRWSPYEMRDYLTMDHVIILKLKPILRFVRFPAGMVPEKSLFFLAWEIYPKTKNREVADVELETYQMFLDDRIYKMPKDFFTGYEGLNRAYNCLIYAINMRRPFPSDEPYLIYEFFATKECLPFLAEMKLMKICKILRLTPLEYFHYSLKKGQKNEILFHFFQFRLRMAAKTVEDLKDKPKEENNEL